MLACRYEKYANNIKHKMDEVHRDSALCGNGALWSANYSSIEQTRAGQNHSLPFLATIGWFEFEGDSCRGQVWAGRIISAPQPPLPSYRVCARRRSAYESEGRD